MIEKTKIASTNIDCFYIWCIKIILQFSLNRADVRLVSMKNKNCRFLGIFMTSFAYCSSTVCTSIHARFFRMNIFQIVEVDLQKKNFSKNRLMEKTFNFIQNALILNTKSNVFVHFE